MAKKGTEKAEVKETKKNDVQQKLTDIKKVILAGNKAFGDGSFFTGNSAPKMDVEAIHTGSLTLDNAIGVGGLPKGRIVEISGLEASGKTLVSLSTIAQAQRDGGIAAFIDVEHALTPDWCRKLGVDFDNLILVQPDSGEKALSQMKFLIESGVVDIVVLDSVAALVTKREIDGDMDANHMALTARLMSLALKKLTPIVAQSKTCCIFINQIRENPGVMYGSKETTPGGKALKFYSSVRLRMGKTAQGAIKDGDLQIGHRAYVKVQKNKVGPPFRQGEFDVIYTSGIDQDSEISSLAIEKGVVERPNNRTYTYGENKWTSRADFDKAIKTDKELAAELRKKIEEAFEKGVGDIVEDDIIEENGKIINKKTGEILDEIVTVADLEDEFKV